MSTAARLTGRDLDHYLWRNEGNRYRATADLAIRLWCVGMDPAAAFDLAAGTSGFGLSLVGRAIAYPIFVRWLNNEVPS